MKALLLVLALMFGAAAPSCAPSRSVQTSVEVVDVEAYTLSRVARSVLKLNIYKKDPEGVGAPYLVGRGSAVLIDQTEDGEALLFLTAAHCLDGDFYRLEGRAGTFDAVEFREGVGGSDDWGFLVAGNPGKLKVEPLPLFLGQLGDIELYSKVFAIGYALGGDLGIVTEGRYQGIEGSYLKFSAPIIFGNSGGALVGFFNGKPALLGVVVAIGTSGGHPITHMGYAVPSSTIRRNGGLP